MVDEQFYARNIEVQTIISPSKKPSWARTSAKISTIIPATDKVHNKLLGKKIIGGDNADQCQEAPPTIIIEKDDNDQICRIIVECVCGKHAELVCTAEDDNS